MYHNPADYVFEVMAMEKARQPGRFAQLWLEVNHHNYNFSLL
jgi:hypothetical protein